MSAVTSAADPLRDDPLRTALLVTHGVLWWAIAITFAVVERPSALPSGVLVGLIETWLLSLVLLRGSRIAWKTLLALDVVQVLAVGPLLLAPTPAGVGLFVVLALRLGLLCLRPVRRGLLPAPAPAAPAAPSAPGPQRKPGTQTTGGTQKATGAKSRPAAGRGSRRKRPPDAPRRRRD